MAECFKEGTAKIIKEEDTFFNPAQKLNRDLSMAVIKSYFAGKDSIRIFSAMSATGLREIRYLNELENAQLFLNDICPRAVETIKKNLELNGFTKYRILGAADDIRAESERVNIAQCDCSVFMNLHHGYFDVIDIDPFGSCACFVNDALRAIKNNGLLCFTCTDKAALCANEKKCYIRYSTHIKRIFSKNETPVRVLLSYLSREFSKYNASIVPVLSLSVDFYIRVIVRVVKNNGKAVLTDNSHALICECLNARIQPFGSRLGPLCELCGSAMRLYGPFWNKSVHDRGVILAVLAEANTEDNKRMAGILRLMEQEIPDMFYYELPMLCSKLKINSCKLRTLMTALANAGFAVSLVHYDNNAIKTSAPLAVINDAMRAIAAGFPDKYSLEPNEAVEKIFEKAYFKGMIMSGLKPLSLPKKNKI